MQSIAPKSITLEELINFRHVRGFIRSAALPTHFAVPIVESAPKHQKTIPHSLFEETHPFH